MGVDADALKSDSRNPTGSDYSTWVQNGTSAFKMTKKGKSYFVWIDENGVKHRAKTVHIPARKGNDFVATAVKKFDSSIK